MHACDWRLINGMRARGGYVAVLTCLERLPKRFCGVLKHFLERYHQVLEEVAPELSRRT